MIYPEVLFTVVFAQIKPAVSSSRIRILLPNYFEPSIAPGEAVFQHHRLRGFHRETDGGIGRNVVQASPTKSSNGSSDVLVIS